MSFSNVFTHGNLVDINVNMWTGQKNLTAEDLGLDEESLSKAYSLGKKKLIPREVISTFKHFDYKARYELIKHSFPFEFGSARFVPKKVFVKFAEKMEKLIKEFNKAADELERNYPRYRLEMRKEYVEAAHEAYRINKSLHKGFDMAENDFVNQFLERIEKHYPSAEDIRSRFKLDYVVFRMEIPDISQASYEDITEEGDKVRLLEDAYKRNLDKKVNSFVDNVVRSLRSKAYDALIHVAESVRRGKTITTATFNMLNSMIQEYEDMDIVGDQKFKKLLLDFKKRFLDNYTPAQVKNDAKIRRTLYHDLKGLATIAKEKNVIKEIAEAYRKRIEL